MLNTRVTLPTGKTICMQGNDGLSPSELQKYLEKAHGQVKRHPVTCNCTGKNEVFLTIRKRKRKDGTTGFHIARFPDSTTNHVNCILYEPEKNKSGLIDYEDAVIKNTEDGIKIALAYPLVWKAVSGAQAPRRQAAPSPKRSASSPRLHTMSALGFLNLLWEKSALNSWSANFEGHRQEFKVVNLLHRTAEAIAVGKHTLSDHFLALPVSPGDWDKERFATLYKRQVNPKGSKERRLSVIVAPLNGIEDTKLVCNSAKSMGLWLNIPLLLANDLRAPGGISAQALRALEQRQQATMAHDEQKKNRSGSAEENIEIQQALACLKKSPRAIFCCLAYLKPKSEKGHVTADVLDAAIMPVTADWIPYSSSFERVIAEELVTQKRTFRKPLRYDASVHKVFPDFELLDTAKTPLPMEVFGRTDESYEARKEEKIAYYNTHYTTQNWWKWIAMGEGKQLKPPPFPPTKAV
ncbi:hypothetical protein ACVWWS_003669 [Pseudomonas chlororaphis]